MTHTLAPLIPLLAAAGATSAGLLAARALGHTRAARTLNIAATLGVAALVCGHLLPECVEVIGPVAVALALVTAVAPTLASRALRRPSRHHAAPRGRAAVVALLVHAVADGFALALPGGSSHVGVGLTGLQAALIFHRLPEGAARWWLLEPLPSTRRRLALAALAIATAGGFALGALVAWRAGGPAIAALQAAAAGLLLHVVADRSGIGIAIGRRLSRRLRVAGSPAAHGDVRLSP